jgi:hypothetical protein
MENFYVFTKKGLFLEHVLIKHRQNVIFYQQKNSKKKIDKNLNMKFFVNVPFLQKSIAQAQACALKLFKCEVIPWLSKLTCLSLCFN